MIDIIEVLVLVIVGIILIWLGRLLFLRFRLPHFSAPRRNQSDASPSPSDPRRRQNFKSGKKGAGGTAGEVQTCFVCSATLAGTERLSTLAFPSLNGGNDRFMHIRGCVHCLGGERDRLCPVCGRVLQGEEILLCRLFERPFRRPHVHVLGCSVCTGPRSARGG